MGVGYYGAEGGGSDDGGRRVSQTWHDCMWGIFLGIRGCFLFGRLRDGGVSHRELGGDGDGENLENLGVFHGELGGEGKVEPGGDGRGGRVGSWWESTEGHRSHLICRR